MKAFKLKFLIDLRDHKQEYHNEFYGPAFHRFLPNDKYDKIDKRLKSFNGSISFWFEKRGVLTDSYIKYDNKKKLTNQDLIPKQAILDAGPLFGEINIDNISVGLIKVLRENNTGNADYLSFAKKIVKDISLQSNDLINIFRYLYKQYWIKNLDPWDSRYQSLGSFCKRDLSMEYSLDSGKTWKPFLPDKEKHVFHIEVSISNDYSDYISQNDWQEIKVLYQNNYKPTIASFYLTQANSTHNKGDLKKAFIEAVTALEIAIEQVVNKNPKISDSILKATQSFSSIPLPSQFTIISFFSNEIESNEIEDSLKAIDIRNKIVHDGYDPIKVETKYLQSLLFSISKIIKEPVTKFPSVNRGNSIMSMESWKKEREKKKKT